VAALSYFLREETPGPSVDTGRPTVESKPAPDKHPGSAEKRKVMRLLESAAAHLAIGRLTEPPGSNAFEAYTMVLEIDPDNEEARQGLDRIQTLLAETQ
jgi:hypothetical protein